MFIILIKENIKDGMVLQIAKESLKTMERMDRKPQGKKNCMIMMYAFFSSVFVYVGGGRWAKVKHQFWVQLSFVSVRCTLHFAVTRQLQGNRFQFVKLPYTGWQTFVFRPPNIMQPSLWGNLASCRWCRRGRRCRWCCPQDTWSQCRLSFDVCCICCWRQVRRLLCSDQAYLINNSLGIICGE